MRMRLIVLGLVLMMSGGAFAEGQWYKGVTHIHTLWSDGDMAPEMVVDWYKTRGYDFVCLSEHNRLQEGEKLVAVSAKNKVTPEHLAAIEERFGEDWVTLKDEDGKPKMQLKTHVEMGKYFNEAGKFLMVPAEEMTSISGAPHVNVINPRELVPGRYGDPGMLLNKYMDEVHAQSEKYGVPMMTHVNHVNFSDGVSIEQMMQARRLQFMEIYNGHPSIRFEGSEKLGMPAEERHWDVLLSMRLPKEPEFILYGMSTDDSHNYHKWAARESNPGRGWVMVRSEKLEENALVEAMQRGDFYGSTGLLLDDVVVNDKTYTVDIAEEDGVSYVTEFVGTRTGFDTSSTEPTVKPEGGTPRPSRVYSGDIGVVLATVEGPEATYTYKGDELYVRARIKSTKPQDNPVQKDAMQRAWTQPVRLVK